MSHTHELTKQYEAGVISQTKSHYPIIDMHLHAVDFVQQTDGFAELLVAMDQAGIEKAVTFGLPVKKKWCHFEPQQPDYYLGDNSPCYYFSLTDEIVMEQYLSLPETQRQRIAPTICGINPTDLSSVDHLAYMYDKYAQHWKGVGEILLRHDDLTNLTEGEVARLNHPAMHKIAAFCQNKKLPLTVHQNVTSIGLHNHLEYKHELLEFAQSFPDLNFIWAHCGISRRVYANKPYAEFIHYVLSSFKNIHLDIAWVVFDDEICEKDSDGHLVKVKDNWLALFVEYSDRFMLGSDLCGHFANLATTMRRYHLLLNSLPAEHAKRIAFSNAEAMWFAD